MKSYLKSTRNHTAKHAHSVVTEVRVVNCFFFFLRIRVAEVVADME